MSLGSVSFLLFAFASVAVYYLLPQRLRSAFLTAAGAVFYCFGAPVFLPLLILTSLWCYGAGLLFEKLEGRGRTAAAAVGVAIPLAVLCSFKYSAGTLGALLSGVPLFSSAISETSGGFSLIMPLGISFYTFTLAGYLLDVYHGRVKAERNLADFLAFATFFPCILSGPINRAGEMLPQFKQKHVWSYEGTVYGLQRFLTGALKKVVIADGLSVIVNGVWAAPSQYGAAAAWLAAIGYTVQLYCDFSGYTDMAAGAAALFGFKTRENFSVPFSATDMSGFWLRWHMSLTSWFTDYIFTPLVWSRWANRLFFGKRWQEHRPHFAVNILIVFALSGAWHGSGLTYVLWGLANGLLRVGEEALHRIKPPDRRRKQPAAVAALKRVSVFLLFTATLILFRAPSLADAGSFAAALFSGPPLTGLRGFAWLVSQNVMSSGTYYAIYFGTLLFALVCLALFDTSAVRAERAGLACPQNPLARIKSPAARMALYWAMGISVMLFYFITYTKLDGSVSFIYAGF